MGGNALKNCVTRRFEAAEYYPLEKTVLQQLRQTFPSRRIEPILAYRNKPSFGDMDILFEFTDADTVAVFAEQVQAVFSPQEMMVATNQITFEYRECQVDLMLTAPPDFQPSLDYYNYNDLGNLLGRVAASMGLKLGHDGLCYRWGEGPRCRITGPVETDWAVILPLLGYSHERWLQGFDEMEDMFHFVVSSPYFNPAPYQYKNQNHASRTRNAKRKTYQEFLAWLSTAPEGTVPAYPQGHKQVWWPYLTERLPALEAACEALQRVDHDAKVHRQRFSAEQVAQWTGRAGPGLAALMKRLREDAGGREGLQAWVQGLDDATLQDRVLALHKKVTRLPKETRYERCQRLARLNPGCATADEVRRVARDLFAKEMVGSNRPKLP